MKRIDIIKLASHLNPSGACVEVGVRKAKFAEQIALTFKCSKIFLIDPYKQFSKTEYTELGNHCQKKQDRIFKQAQRRMKKYGPRVEFIRRTSAEAVNKFKDNSLSFVYIDANHSYEYAKQDIQLWFSKVEPGGVLAGHDYYNSNILNICGVKRAIEEFISENPNISLIITDELIPSWFFIKPCYCNKKR